MAEHPARAFGEHVAGSYGARILNTKVVSSECDGDELVVSVIYQLDRSVQPAADLQDPAGVERRTDDTHQWIDAGPPIGKYCAHGWNCPGI